MAIDRKQCTIYWSRQWKYSLAILWKVSSTTNIDLLGHLSLFTLHASRISLPSPLSTINNPFSSMRCLLELELIKCYYITMMQCVVIKKTCSVYCFHVLIKRKLVHKDRYPLFIYLIMTLKISVVTIGVQSFIPLIVSYKRFGLNQKGWTCFVFIHCRS